MRRNSIFLATALCGVLFANQTTLHAQTAPSTTSNDIATAKQKHKEEIANEKKKAAEQWPTDSHKALETWAATRQKRQDCQKQASEQKLYFAKRSRFVKECIAAKSQ